MATKIVNPPAGSMGADAIKHRYGTIDAVAVNTNIANCDVLDIRDYLYVALKPSAGITTLTFYGAETAAGTYVVIDSIGTNGAVTVVAAKWNALDTTKIGPFGFIKMVPNTNGTVEVVAKT